MELVVIGESHQNHEQQWYDCEEHNARDRECQQRDMESVVFQLNEIFLKRIDWMSP
jgi:hypothetical protein